MDEVCNENTMPIISSILELNSLPEHAQPESIQLIINTPGGSAAAMFQLIDTMKLSQIPIHTVGMGEVKSAGVFVLMAGKKGTRCATNNTILMSHQFASGYGGKQHELEAAAVEVGLITELTLRHYIEYTGKTESFVKKYLLPPSDISFTAAKAVKFGIIDAVV